MFSLFLQESVVTVLIKTVLEYLRLRQKIVISDLTTLLMVTGVQKFHLITLLESYYVLMKKLINVS